MYSWRFFRSARTLQVQLTTGEDMMHLAELDRKLWSVLALPVKGIHLDARTLEFLDADGDGRVRVEDLLAAIAWLKPRLKDLEVLFAESRDVLPYTALNEATEEGRTLLSALKDIARQNGQGEATGVRLADVTAIDAAFKGTPFNGDGVVTELSTSDAALVELLAAVGSAEGTTPDRSGHEGVDQKKIDAFYADAAAHIKWLADGRADAAIFFLGDKTAAADAELSAVEARIDAFFRPADDLPLVTEAPDPVLPLTHNLHPLWAEPFATFAREVAAPVLEQAEVTELSRAAWRAVKAKFAPYREWRAAEAGAAVAKLGEAKLRAWLENASLKEAVAALVKQDLARADTYDKLVEAERLLRYVAHLAEFARNFVNQASLYDPERVPLYHAGELYIAGRVCMLCFDVADEGAHAALAEKSRCCLLYAKIVRKMAAETRTICAVITAGTTAPLYVGRNGVFYDRAGGEWDAVVTKVVAAPVSLREAFWAPWKKLGETVAGQVRKFIGDRQDVAVEGVSKVIDGVGANAAPPKSGADGTQTAALASSVAALGVGIGMMGAAFAGLIGLVAGLPWWKTVLAVVAIILAVSLPSVILAAVKLRTRDLGAILNAGGWAVNRPLHFSFKLGSLFTRLAKVPMGAQTAHDPYAGAPWCRILVAVLALVVAALAVAWKLAWGPFAPAQDSCADGSCLAPLPTATTEGTR